MNDLPNNRAVVIPFHHYGPHVGEGYKCLWELFLKNLPLWSSEVNKIYIIDSDMDFSDEDIRRAKILHPNIVFLKREIDGHHWVQFKWILPKIEEENMLFMDNDVVITKSGVIDGWFKAIEDGADFVGSFDGSGGMHDQMLKFPFIQEHPEFNRMGSYYFIWTKKLLNKMNNFNDFAPMRFDEQQLHISEIDYDTLPTDWLDSFGLFTIKMLATNPKIHIIEDPRDTVYLQPEEEDWVIKKEPEEPENLGYYHIRNGNLANYVLSSKEAGNLEDYQREITANPRELLRSLAWFYYCLDDYDGTPLIQLLKDMGIRYKQFLKYYDAFLEYHELE